jgi:hypothetical protein
LDGPVEASIAPAQTTLHTHRFTTEPSNTSEASRHPPGLAIAPDAQSNGVPDQLMRPLS